VAGVFNTPVIGVVCFAVILANWFGGVRYFGGVPGGLVAIAPGTVIAWASTALGLGYGDLSLGHWLRQSSTSAFLFRCRRSTTRSTASATSASSW
jgi:AGZA family xanthine/uracil permease-like MFS transporter